eukprot:TRINITY_DN70218_c0_g1_i1.p1 TRINITY_DN70218_c0_g1~~TRINITY_DN70218_c0_g1_i1.p1  ORF type:complete len:434 (-),score=60.46 TRINITY_DN70218_c0_g1_i1:36-1337(-)
MISVSVDEATTGGYRTATPALAPSTPVAEISTVGTGSATSSHGASNRGTASKPPVPTYFCSSARPVGPPRTPPLPSPLAVSRPQQVVHSPVYPGSSTGAGTLPQPNEGFGGNRLTGGVFGSSGVSAVSSVASSMAGCMTPGSRKPVSGLGYLRRTLTGDVSEGPSESSANVEDTAEDELHIPHLERFYEQLAAKARLPEGQGASSSWVLSLARSYRRLSKDKRRRGRLRELLQPASSVGLSTTSGDGLPCAKMEQPGWSSNTDDSGYEAGYETDADESELSEWENASARRQGHKRKLDTLVHLTFKLGLSENSEVPMDGYSSPPWKTQRAMGTHAVGSRLPLAPRAPLAAPPPSPGGSASRSSSPPAECNDGGGAGASGSAAADASVPTSAGAAASSWQECATQLSSAENSAGAGVVPAIGEQGDDVLMTDMG